MINTTFSALTITLCVFGILFFVVFGVLLIKYILDFRKESDLSLNFHSWSKKITHKELEEKLLQSFLLHIENNNGIISVNELCKLNYISRTTFYNHFPSADYFLKLMIVKFVCELNDLLLLK